LLEDGHDLAIGKARGFHRILFKSKNIEILLLSPIKEWEYYPHNGLRGMMYKVKGFIGLRIDYFKDSS